MVRKGQANFLFSSTRSRDVTNTKSKIFPLRVGPLTSGNRKSSCMISDNKVALGESTEAQSVFQSNSGTLKSPTRTISGFVINKAQYQEPFVDPTGS